MARKRKTNITKKAQSPLVQKASAVKKKYRTKAASVSPGRRAKVRRALYAVEEQKVPIRKAARQNNLSYGFLYRRLSGEVDIDKGKGPATVFTKSEEEAIANWLQEMAERGMGLKPGEFLDFIQGIVKSEKRKTPFKDGRPGYAWYYSFMARNRHIVQIRSETPLEACRAKVTKDKTDSWYSTFRDFLSENNLLDKPTRIWNADETGFSMGSISSSKVIGPSRKESSYQVPHVTGGQSKQRLTVMFCGAADGSMMPPFFIYPEPKPRGYNPLTGAAEGSAVAYTKKGWMDSPTFLEFIKHFDKHAGPERPVVLLIDSVSSHVNMGAFEEAKERGIQLYRIIPNATHLMQPLDKGVFGPLKTRWHQIVRRHCREHPGSPISKENFAEKLKEAYLLFYKPLTVINSFKSSGIYPVDSTVISADQVKPGLTFCGSEEAPEPEASTSEQADASQKSVETSGAKAALSALESALATPAKDRYRQRIEEGYDLTGQSPCFDVYKRLHDKSKEKCTSTKPELSEKEQEGIHLLADTALSMGCQSVALSKCETSTSSSGTDDISASIQKALTFPKAHPTKAKRRGVLDDLPDSLTSPACIRAMAMREISKIRIFAAKEKRAKAAFLKEKEKSKRQQKSKTSGKHKTKTSRRQKGPSEPAVNHTGDLQREQPNEDSAQCVGCHMTWAEDQMIFEGSTWIQCHQCSQWVHADCCNLAILGNDPFHCPECSGKQ